MRFPSSVLILLTTIIFFFVISNAIPTTPSSYPLHAKRHDSPPNKAIRTDLTSTSTTTSLSLHPRDLSTPSKLVTNSLKVHNPTNFTISLPPTTTTTSNPTFQTFYTQITSTITSNISNGDPAHAFVFTVGSYRMEIRCPTEAIPWSLLGDIVEEVKRWTGDRWAPVKATLSVDGVNPYLVASPVVIWIGIRVAGLEFYA